MRMTSSLTSDTFDRTELRGTEKPRSSDAAPEAVAGIPSSVWFEYMLIGFAESIWNTGGIDAMVAFQQTLGEPTLSPDAVVQRLAAIDPAVASAVRAWPAG